MINKNMLKTIKSNILVSTICIVTVSLGLYYIIDDEYPSVKKETFDTNSTSISNKTQGNDDLSQDIAAPINDENDFIKKKISGGFFDNKMGASTTLSDGGGSNLTYVPFMNAISLPSSFVDSLEKNKYKIIETEDLSAYTHEEKSGKNMQEAEDLFNQINADRASKYTELKNKNNINTSDTKYVPGGGGGGGGGGSDNGFNEPSVPGWLAILRPVFRAITKAFSGVFDKIADIKNGLNRIFGLFEQVFEFFRKIFAFFDVVVEVFKYLGSVFVWFYECLKFIVMWFIKFPSCFLWYLLQVFGWILYIPIGFFVWCFPDYLKPPHDLVFYKLVPDIDCSIFYLTGFHVFHYSEEVLNRCYGTFPPFPQWNFSF